MLTRIAVIVLLLTAVVAGGLFGDSFTSDPAPNGSIVTQTDAVKVSMPVDLAGKWESEVSRVTGSKMVASVKNNTIHVEIYANEGYTGLWYGTFDILQPGEKTITSKAIDDPNHLVLSSSETKDFLYQGQSLVFDYSVMGTRTTVEMRRVAG